MSYYSVAVFSDDPSDDSFYKLLAPYSENNKKYCTEMKRMSQGVYEGIKRAYAAAKSQKTFNEFVKAQGYVDMPDGAPAYGYFYNPNAKWNLYTLDDDNAALPAEKNQKTDNCYGTWHKHQIDFNHTGGVPYAFVTPDGVWHAPENMDGFAASGETEESFLAYEKEFTEYVLSSDNPYVRFASCTTEQW